MDKFEWDYGVRFLKLNNFQGKTKKITTVTLVWICIPNYHKILQTLTLNSSKNY